MSKVPKIERKRYCPYGDWTSLAESIIQRAMLDYVQLAKFLRSDKETMIMDCSRTVWKRERAEQEFECVRSFLTDEEHYLFVCLDLDRDWLLGELERISLLK